MENFLNIIAYLLIGIFLKQIKKIPRDFSNALNLFVIYISLPALVLLKVPKLTFSKELIFTATLPWIMVVISAAFVILFSKLFGWKRQLTGCLLLMIPLGNTSFLGIPMVKAFFGEEATAYAIIYDQLGSFLALSTYGAVILALYSSSKTNTFSFKETVYKIVTFPPFIALIIAGFLWGQKFPAIIEGLLFSLGSTLVPLVMVAVGFQLGLKLEEGGLAPLSVGLLIKLCIAPAFAILIAKLFQLNGIATQVALFEAGMPPMVSAGALAILAGLSPRLTAALVGFGIFLSFITLPLLQKLIITLL